MVFQSRARMSVSAACLRSSVTTTAMVMLSSISGNRSPAPSRTQASFCATVEGYAGLVILGLQKPRAQAELEAATGEQVERRRFLGQDYGMAVVIVDNEGANAHGLRHAGRGHERRERRELVPEMVGDEVVPDQKGRVPQLLGPARVGVPCAGRLHAFIDHTEAEGSR